MLLNVIGVLLFIGACYMALAGLTTSDTVSLRATRRGINFYGFALTLTVYWIATH